MKAREYSIMLEAVQSGVHSGLNRYNKHRDIPVGDDPVLIEYLVNHVMQSIGDYFIWEDLIDE